MKDYKVVVTISAENKLDLIERIEDFTENPICSFDKDTIIEQED